MKKSWYFLAVIAIMASCSQNEILDQNLGDAISFKVSTESSTKAAAIFSSTNNITSFKVFANKGTSAYMPGTVVSYENSAWSYSPSYYWPAEGSLTFHAFYPSDATCTYDGVTNFTVADAVANQIDLLYAANTGSKTDNGTTPVSLNFRHALSQIAFAYEVEDGASFSVEMGGYKIGGIKGGTGSYTLGSEVTSTQILASGSYTTTGAGTWNLTSSTIKVYSVTATGSNQELLLFPQTASAWVKTGTVKPTATTTGGYITLLLKVMNTTDNSYIAGDASSYAEISLPVNIAWEQGKKYTYKFKFLKNGSGYDDILQLVKFTVTVDDFFPTSEIPINANAGA